MPADSEVGVVVLLPDVLGTYSDTGNATVLVQRLRWRGIAARVIEVTASETPPLRCPLYLLGGGEDTAQQAAAAWLKGHRALASTLADRAVTLAVCAGLQLLGHTTTDRNRTCHEGLGLLDLVTVPGRRRQVGEAVGRCTIEGVGPLTGFHNHAGASILGPGVVPLAHTRRGPSNHPGGRLEGAITAPRARTRDGAVEPGVVATYLHGPVLARNPDLADHLLARALGTTLPDLDPGLVPDLPTLRRAYLEMPWSSHRRARRGGR